MGKGKGRDSWNKYGSTYDPNHKRTIQMGKMIKPTDQFEQTRREHQLRGCFDPACAFCNPDTAAAGSGARAGTNLRASTPTGGGSPRPNSMEAAMRAMSEVARRLESDNQMMRFVRASSFPTFDIGEGVVTMWDESSSPQQSRTFRTKNDAEDWINENRETISNVNLRPMFNNGSTVFAVTYVQKDGAKASRPKPIPQSYKAAREEVAKWIHPAPVQSFGDIIGNDEALEQIRDAITAPIEHAELYKAYGMRMPKGALLSGPPGCGKTMFARAAASEMRRLYGDKVEFISISGSELQSPYVGVTEGHIKNIFTFAREYKAYHGHPLLVFMDEADALLPDRTGRIRRVASWEESQVATFLAEMDGMHESGAFVMLASNRPDVIDQAVLRDGRCDFKITVKRPTMDAVETIIRRNFVGTLMADDAEQLVFAAVECFYDPNKIIGEAGNIGIDFEKHEVHVTDRKHFLLEHIVSGAMAASVPGRAKRYAFARDKATGVAKGITVADVVASVNDLFAENRELEHSFALEEFKREFMEEVKARQKKEHGK